jgi:threonine aldolase
VPEARCPALQAALAEAGVLAAIAPVSRFVLHRDVSAAGVERTIRAMKAYFAA